MLVFGLGVRGLVLRSVFEIVVYWLVFLSENREGGVFVDDFGFWIRACCCWMGVGFSLIEELCL